MTMAAYEAAKAFINGNKYHKGPVSVYNGVFVLYDTVIAEMSSPYHGAIFPKCYDSNTTRRYLNGILDYIDSPWPRIRKHDGEIMIGNKLAPHGLGIDLWHLWVRNIHLVTHFGDPVSIGDKVKGRNGPTYEITGWSTPHKPGSTGRVEVYRQTTGERREFFPGVFDLRWEKKGEI